MSAPAPARPQRLRIALALLLVAGIIAGLVVALSSTTDRSRTGATATLTDCARSIGRDAMRGCYITAMLREVRGARDVTPVLQRIEMDVNRIGEYPAANCHVLMHTVGRRYARMHHVSLASLMQYLPRSNDAGCAAGFAHGMITAIAPEILRAGPAAAEEVCDQAATRFLRYSCTHGLGHAYMRFYAESLEPSLRLCRALGLNAAADCAQGVYHDYWLAVHGSDDTKAPPQATANVRALCATQPRGFVLSCWYRAFIESRPGGYQTKTAGDLTHLCRAISELQREGCITAASVIGSPNPLTQMRVCAQMPRGDAVPCVHGVKVQNLIGTPASNQLLVIGRCALFKGPHRDRVL